MEKTGQKSLLTLTTTIEIRAGTAYVRRRNEYECTGLPIAN